MLGIFPAIIPQLREITNRFHFSVLTSGFNAVTNNMLLQLLEETLSLISVNKIQMLRYPDFFESGYKFKWDKDVSHYLDKVADKDDAGKLRGVCHRIVRAMVDIYKLKSKDELIRQIQKNIELISASYSGEKNPPDIQRLKGMLREFEEELVWAHYGVPVRNIEHLRLGFYTGDIFTQQPDRNRDVEPILHSTLKALVPIPIIRSSRLLLKHSDNGIWKGTCQN
jgi:glucosamine-6-phosphate deaminase